VLVGLVAAVIASDPDSQVLALVSNAWAGFGAAFGPLIILSLMWSRTNGAGAIAGMVAGAATVIVWISMGWNAEFMGGPGVYEIIPGFIISMIAILVVSSVTADAGEYQHIER
jgi:SSS family solute:Na+ symporter